MLYIIHIYSVVLLHRKWVKTISGLKLKCDKEFGRGKQNLFTCVLSFFLLILCHQYQPVTQQGGQKLPDRKILWANVMFSPDPVRKSTIRKWPTPARSHCNTEKYQSLSFRKGSVINSSCLHSTFYFPRCGRNLSRIRKI